MCVRIARAANERPLLAANKICPEMATRDCPVTASSHGERRGLVGQGSAGASIGAGPASPVVANGGAPPIGQSAAATCWCSTNQSAPLPGVLAMGAALPRSHPDQGNHVCDSYPIEFTTPKALRPARPRHSKPGFLPTLHCQSMRLQRTTASASASGKANRSTPCARWLKARSDYGRTTSTTRCTWTGLRRSSQSSRLIAAPRIWVIWELIPSGRSGFCDRVAASSPQKRRWRLLGG